MDQGDNDSDNGEGGFGSLKGGSTDSGAIAAYYDAWAATYDDNLKDWDYQAPVLAANTLGAHLEPGRAVLDVGCGTGLFARALADVVACRVTGLDISEASLKLAQEQGGYDRVQQHDLQKTPLPLADDAFDAAACIGVLTYIEDAPALLAELCRVVRPGGHILFTQRDDRWAEQNFDGLIADLDARGLWTPVAVSDAKPYLPGHDDFADDICVIYVLCRVV